jgi:hypothetical protein
MKQLRRRTTTMTDPLVTLYPARLVIQVFDQAREILPTQAEPNFFVGNVEAQQDVLIGPGETDFRRVKVTRVDRVAPRLSRCHFENVPCFT